MRTLTITVKVNQPEANWLWESLKNNQGIHGVKVTAIKNGDLIQENNARIEAEEIKAYPDYWSSLGDGTSAG